jgi:hypothetical protein
LKAAAAGDPSIDPFCPGNLVGTTYTLIGNCGPSAFPITVPANIATVDGAGHTIFGDDTAPGDAEFDGGVLMNDPANHMMNIKNLTIAGPATGFQECGPNGAADVLYGIWFKDASGTLNNVIVDHIWQQQSLAFPSCQTGRAVRADGVTAARTVTITSTKVMDYQKSGFEARGLGASMTMDVSGSAAGPPHALEGCIAQNAIEWVFADATGTAARNTFIGSGDQGPPTCATESPDNGTAVLMYGATGVTVDHNVITGSNTDIGVSVTAGSTGDVISFNQIGRTAPDTPDPTGHGIDVDNTPVVRTTSANFVRPAQVTAADPPPDATLTCNTFTNWRFNVVGALQIACTPLPNGCESQPYSAHTPAVEGFTQTIPPGPPTLAWSTTAGTLPPGLTLASHGAITGTPTALGTSHFTVQVDDPSDPNLLATQAESITIADCTPPTTTVPVTPTTAGPDTATAPADVTGTLPRTGGTGALPLVGLALLGAGTLFTGVARRERGRRRKAS